MQNDNRDDEFLISRIIFLLTYNTSTDLTNLVEEQNLAKSICRVTKLVKSASVS